MTHPVCDGQTKASIGLDSTSDSISRREENQSHSFFDGFTSDLKLVARATNDAVKP